MKDWELVNFCEFDKYASKSYCAIHNEKESKNLGDITKVDETKMADFNMMTWGFPCTDISCAGKKTGFIDENGNKTRSGMYYEGIRILREKKPAISIIENVKNLMSKKFEKEFKMILSDLDEAGYNSYYKVLNAKDFGIPQNRERVFIVSIRKDLDNGKFKFPDPIGGFLALTEVLEKNVDKKYYLSQDKVERFIKNSNIEKLNKALAIGASRGRNPENPSDRTVGAPTEQRLEINLSGVSNTLTTVCKDNLVAERPCFLGNIYNPNYGTGYAGGVWDPNYISPTLTTSQGGQTTTHYRDQF